MPHNPLLNALMRIQPGANRMDFADGSGFDDDAAREGLLGGAPAQVDQLGALRGARRQELNERIFNETRAPNKFMPGQLDALKGALGILDQEEADDPLQQEMAMNQKANLAGFGSGDEMMQFGRDFDMAKASIPLDVARTNMQGGVRQAEIRGNTAVRQAETQGKYALDKQGLIEDTRRQGFGKLGEFMGAPGDGRSRSMSIPGVGATSLGAERPEAVTPAALQTNLMNARRQFARTQSPQDKAGLDQAIANLVNSAPVSETTKQWAHTIATNPQLAAMPLEKIIQAHEQGTGDVLGPEEITELSNLMKQVLAGMNDPQQ